MISSWNRLCGALDERVQREGGEEEMGERERGKEKKWGVR